jgi:hypothetical protein
MIPPIKMEGKPLGIGGYQNETTLLISRWAF